MKQNIAERLEARRDELSPNFGDGPMDQAAALG